MKTCVVDSCGRRKQLEDLIPQMATDTTAANSTLSNYPLELVACFPCILITSVVQIDYVVDQSPHHPDRAI